MRIVAVLSHLSTTGLAVSAFNKPPFRTEAARNGSGPARSDFSANEMGKKKLNKINNLTYGNHRLKYLESMSAFDLDSATWERAEQRFADKRSVRVDPQVLALLRSALAEQEKPSMMRVWRDVGRHCKRLGLRAPSRATIYNLLPLIDGHAYALTDLPKAMRDALYNLPEATSVPGRQVAFYGINYGSFHAVQFVAGMPWLDLYQAGRMAGYRPKSRGLLDAILHVRGI